MASTTQLYNPRLAKWSERLIGALDFPRSIFPEVAQSATTLGPLKPALAEESGLANVNVVVSLSHDTACAVAACPTESDRWAYISSGTWSLMGLELPEPIVTDACRELNFTNEIGYGGSIRLLKNIIGLWLVQECRRAWAAGGNDYSYADLADLAASAEPHRSFESVRPAFSCAGQHAAAHRGDLSRDRATGAGITRAISAAPSRASRCSMRARCGRRKNSSAGRRRNCTSSAAAVETHCSTNSPPDAANIEVVAGPTEATASGNVLVQSIAAGEVSRSRRGTADRPKLIRHRVVQAEPLA